ncbi:MAG: transposase, partial [Gemmataceae bacterium]
TTGRLRNPARRYKFSMDRHWLLTSTFYGTWLPGDERGFVGSVRDKRPDDPSRIIRLEHDIPGTPYDQDFVGLKIASTELMKGPPIILDNSKAHVLLSQFLETAGHRQWTLLAVAIMCNHFHLVVEVPGDPSPTKVLGDFKAWGSRAFSKNFGRPSSETWWTYDGSKRKLSDKVAITAAIIYVLTKQYNPLVTWCPTR